MAIAITIKSNMLQRITNKLVQGVHFSVTILNVHQIKYTEGSRFVLVEIEGSIRDDGQVDWLVYSETLRRWEPPNNSEEILPDNRAEILSRINESLDKLQMLHRIV